MPISTEILEIRSLLEQAEREIDREMKAHEMRRAFNLLQALEEDLSDEERSFVSNLKIAHARRLLTQFAAFPSIPFHVWAGYFPILLYLGNEIQALIAEDSTLRDNRERFLAPWREELLKALRENGVG